MSDIPAGGRRPSRVRGVPDELRADLTGDQGDDGPQVGDAIAGDIWRDGTGGLWACYGAGAGGPLLICPDTGEVIELPADRTRQRVIADDRGGFRLQLRQVPDEGARYARRSRVRGVPPEFGGTPFAGWPDDRLRAVLTQIAALVDPCPVPNVTEGYDQCPHGTWPCATTRAGWLARGMDPEREAARIIARERERFTFGYPPARGEDR
jgi:hypothetical protein